MTQGMSNNKKLLFIVLACIQNMTLGGILFGWASISGSLLISDKEDGGPGLSTQYVHMMFVVATFFNFLGPLVLGVVLDNYGPRTCSLLSITFVSSGCLLFAISDKEKLPLFMPAICLIAFGGPGAQSAIIHLSNLFPNWKATATAFITGSFQLSFIVFLVFDQLWLFKKCTYTSLFMGYCMICASNAIISVFFWPDIPFSFDEQLKALEEEDEEDDDLESEQVPLGHIRLPSVFIHHRDYQKLKRSDSSSARLAQAAATGSIPLKEASLVQQLMSGEFIYLTYFFLINAFWVNFYIGTFDVQLRDQDILQPGEEANFARLFTLIITLGVVAIPLIGTIMDTFGFPFTSAVTIGAGIVWSLLLVTPTRLTLIASFIFYAVFRTFLYTFYFAYLADTLGFKYFGVLAGVAFVLGGVISFLQYPLAELASGSCASSTGQSGADDCEGGNWRMVNIVMATTVTSTLIFSYADWQRKRESNKWKHAVRQAEFKMEDPIMQEMTPFNVAPQQEANRPLRSALKGTATGGSGKVSGSYGSVH